MDTTEILAVVKALGLSITAKFVPFSQSRHKKEKHPSLNWDVTLLRNDKEIVTTPYMAGSGHCPANTVSNKVERDHRIIFECETGMRSTGVNFLGARQPEVRHRSEKINPNMLDVLYCLVSDSSVLDCPSFEDWASELGYDTDSRKAENIYATCLGNSLKLRAAIGEDGLQKLREAFQDY